MPDSKPTGPDGDRLSSARDRESAATTELDNAVKARLDIEASPSDVAIRPAGAGALSAPPGETQFSSMIRAAVDSKLDVASIKELVALHNQQADRMAAGEFYAAMAQFQSACPSIPKSSTATVLKEGRKIAEYHYAELPTIAAIINPLLSRVGLSYTWDAKVDAAGMLTCTCKVRHAAGHSEESSFSCPIGGTSLMSDAQKGAATLTYAKRQALVSVLGLTTGDADIDGAGEIEAPAAVTETQAANLRALADEVGANLPLFFKFFGIKAFAELPAARMKEAVAMLEAKRK